MIDKEKLPQYGSTVTVNYQFWLNGNASRMEYEEHIKVTFSCNFNFEDYPFDENHCPFNFGIINANADKAMFNPIKAMIKDENDAVSLSANIPIPNRHLPFDFEMMPSNEIMDNYTTYFYQSTKTGVILVLKRNKVPVSNFYMPTGIFAILSMISFVINPEHVPGRMGLLITLFLISTNVYNSLKAPAGRGFSFIEIWLIGAWGTILFGIIEYGLILGWKQHSSKDGSVEMEKTIKSIGRKANLRLGIQNFSNTKTNCFSDTFALILCILLFLGFNSF